MWGIFPKYIYDMDIFFYKISTPGGKMLTHDIQFLKFFPKQWSISMSNKFYAWST